ncbi:LexA family protein [Leptospira santarosai]|uniref:LexA family protein n=1 Tax=Leptospira santarosai TaxID=28183 RepID=UPI0026E2B9E2|nr:repressor LexA [Leptospira santarosai]MDO6383366.1 repressor LexA [Leptospira santarosai]
MLDRKIFSAVHSEFSGDMLTEVLREINIGLTEDELRRLIKVRLRKIGVDVPLESITIGSTDLLRKLEKGKLETDLEKKEEDCVRKDLTAIQLSTLKFIDDFIRTVGLPPTYREIALHYVVTTKTIVDRILSMERKGFLKRMPMKSRGTILTSMANEMLLEAKEKLHEHKK